MKLNVLLLSVVITLTACANNPISHLKVGQQVDFALLQDQYSNPFPHDDNMEMLVFTNSMESSGHVREVLHVIAPDCYETGRLVYVADVSGMPSLITRLIAVPKMRGYSFPIWLDYEGEATEALPVKEDQISLVTVKDGNILSIDFVAGKEDLMTQLTALCGYAKEQVAQR